MATSMANITITNLERPNWEPGVLRSFGERTNATECTRGDLTTTPALVLQAVLGLLAFSVLIIKRFCEPPDIRRNWLQWFLDISKQGLSQFMIHCINILLAEYYTNEQDPCTYYLMSFVLDSTIGIIMIWIGLKFSEFAIVKFEIMGGFPFGDYNMAPRYRQDRPPSTDSSSDEEILPERNSGQPTTNHRVESYSQRHGSFQYRSGVSERGSFLTSQERRNNTLTDSVGTEICRDIRESLNFRVPSPRGISIFQSTRPRPRTDDDGLPFSVPVWLLQTTAYVIVTIVVKIIIFHILKLENLQGLYLDVRKLLTAWIPNKSIEILFVLFIVPLILNSFMFWVIDNILMRSGGILTAIKKFQRKITVRFATAYPGAQCCCPCLIYYDRNNERYVSRRSTRKNSTAPPPGDANSLATGSIVHNYQQSVGDTGGGQTPRGNDSVDQSRCRTPQGRVSFAGDGPRQRALAGSGDALEGLREDALSPLLSSSGVSGDLFDMSESEASLDLFESESLERVTLVTSHSAVNQTNSSSSPSQVFNSKRVQQISASIDSACDSVRHVLVDLKSLNDSQSRLKSQNKGESYYTNSTSCDDEAPIIDYTPTQYVPTVT